MSFLCSNCGVRIEVPSGFSKKKIRCPECGVDNSILSTSDPSLKETLGNNDHNDRSSPISFSTSAQEFELGRESGTLSVIEDVSSQTPQTVPEASDTESREILLQGTEEDDLNPYTVKGDAPTKPCPKCQERLPPHAVVCSKCGYHFEKKRSVKRRYEPVHRSWESFWPLQTRIVVFVILQIVNLVAFVLVVSSGRAPLTMVLVAITALVIAAFVCGTYDRLTLSRTSKGKVTLASHWRIAFYPLPPQNIHWREHEGITLVTSNEINLIRLILLMILLGYCIPGCIFWWLVIHRDKYTVMLCRGHGCAETPIFRTLDVRRGMEVLETVSEVTGLPIHH